MSGQDDKFWFIDVVKIRYDQIVRLFTEEEVELSTLSDRLQEAMNNFGRYNCFNYSCRFLGALKECYSTILLSPPAREELEWIVTASDKSVERRYQK